MLSDAAAVRNLLTTCAYLCYTPHAQEVYRAPGCARGRDLRTSCGLLVQLRGASQCVRTVPGCSPGDNEAEAPCRPHGGTMTNGKAPKFRRILRIIARIARAIARVAHALAGSPTKGKIKPRRKP